MQRKELHSPETIPSPQNKPPVQSDETALNNLMQRTRKRIGAILCSMLLSMPLACASFNSVAAERSLEIASTPVSVRLPPQFADPGQVEPTLNTPSMSPLSDDLQSLRLKFTDIEVNLNVIDSFLKRTNHDMHWSRYGVFMEFLANVNKKLEELSGMYGDMNNQDEEKTERPYSPEIRDFLLLSQVKYELLMARYNETRQNLLLYKEWVTGFIRLATQTKSVLDKLVAQAPGDGQLRNSLYRIFTNEMKSKYSFTEFCFAWSFLMDGNLQNLIRNINGIQLESITTIGENEINMHFQCPADKNFKSGTLKLKKNPKSAHAEKPSIGYQWGLAAIKIFRDREKDDYVFFPPDAQSINWD
jgi:hypothetical protein